MLRRAFLHKIFINGNSLLITHRNCLLLKPQLVEYQKLYRMSEQVDWKIRYEDEDKNSALKSYHQEPYHAKVVISQVQIV